MRRILPILLVLAVRAPAAAAPCQVIVGAALHGGAVTPVVIEGGRIRQVGGAPPPGCARFEAGGGVVTPGLIDAFTHLGVVEVDLEPFTSDVDAGQGRKERVPRLRPAFRVSDAYNPWSSVIPVTRLGGVTSAIVVPAGGIVSGQSAWVDLAGATQAAAIRRPQVAMHIRLGGSDASRASAFLALRALVSDARELGRRKADWEAGRSRPFRISHLDLQALVPVLDRRIPLAVQVDRAADIEAVLRLAREESLRVVLVGAAEGWLLASALGAAKVPVVVDPLLYGPETFDQVRARPDNVALLAAAGVPVMMSAFWTHNTRTLRQVAGNAVRAGLPRGAALDAITRTPADTFGMPGYGRLEAGAVANVVVWSGDPFELSSVPRLILIGGRTVALRSRQTELRDRWLRRTGPPEPLPLPSSAH